MDSAEIMSTIETGIATAESVDTGMTILEGIKEYGLPGLSMGVGTVVGYKTTNRIGDLIKNSVVVTDRSNGTFEKHHEPENQK